MPEHKLSVCEVRLLGQIPFLEAWKLQGKIRTRVAQGNHPATLLLLEHPHTYTFGRRGDLNNLLWDQETLQQHEIEIHWIDRGGDVTYHGPGQLVGYPILQLGRLDRSGQIPQADYVEYLRQLERMLIGVSAELGLAAGQLSGNTGVWVQPDIASRCPNCPPEAKKTPSKLASIGVKIDSRGISQHGFALNVNPDARYWEGIIACGDPEHPPISLADLLDPSPTMASVVDSVISNFGKVFDFEMVITETTPSDWTD